MTHDQVSAVSPSLAALATILAERGPIPTARVSRAQARGRAKQYAYWGAVRYLIVLSADGHPVHRALERAGSDRRSRPLAERDAEDLAERESRLVLQAGPGRLSAEDADYVLRVLAREVQS